MKLNNCVIVYRIFSTVSYTRNESLGAGEEDHYCHAVAYLFAFWFLTATLIVPSIPSIKLSNQAQPASLPRPGCLFLARVSIYNVHCLFASRTVRSHPPQSLCYLDSASCSNKPEKILVLLLVFAYNYCLHRFEVSLNSEHLPRPWKFQGRPIRLRIPTRYNEQSGWLKSAKSRHKS